MTPEQQQHHRSGLMNTEPGSKRFEQGKAVLMQAAAEGLIRRIEELDETITKASVGSEIVAKRLFWLNCVIAAATATGAIATAVQAYAVFAK